MNKIKSETIEFLKLLSKNNDREWFHENKRLYDDAHNNFIEVVEDVINEVAKFDPEIGTLNAKDTLFGIYRDLRFSPNETPYKLNFASALVNDRKKTFGCAGYYIQIQPGNCMLAGGFLKIIKDKEFTDNLVMHGDKLKRIPRGFDENDPMADFLNLKEFVVYHTMTDAEVLSQSFVSQCFKVFKAAKPFNDFVNDAITEYCKSINNN
ncbi:MAG: DUF2461 domain-containing protein [Ferruginibacter sp.]